MKTISLCMIVRDEENNIRRCLESVHPIVDEIIIVDTGSTDSTKSICREFDVKLYDFQWMDDFSMARNFALEQAACDWILWMDADEELWVSDKIALQNFLEDTKSNFILMKMIHFYGAHPSKEQHSYLSSNFRVFRNREGIRFKGKIHEALDMKQIDEVQTTPLIKILHYGYMDKNIKSKTERNLRLLFQVKSEDPDNLWLDYHIATEYYRIQDYVKAFDFINKALVGFLKKSILPPSVAYKLKYDILITSKNFEQAYYGIDKAIALYPDYVDLYFYKGLILYNKRQYKEAIDIFSYCLILGENHPNYLVMSGVGSFFSLYCMGTCYEMCQEYEKAEEAYRQSLALYTEVAAEGKAFLS